MMNKLLTLLIAEITLPALAGIYTQDIAAVQSRYELSEPGNVVVEVDLPAEFGLPAKTPLFMTAYRWDVTIGTFGASYLNEASLSFDDAVEPYDGGFTRAPGESDSHSGTNTYRISSFFVFAENGVPDLHLPDGRLRMEFYETFDDPGPPVDAEWISGTVEIRAVPFPAAPARIVDATHTNGLTSLVVSNFTVGVLNRLEVSTNSFPLEGWVTLDQLTTLDTNLSWHVSVSNRSAHTVIRVRSSTP
jgi:hypothetical protein